MKARIKFLLLAALFIAPLAAAWVLFFVEPDWQPEGHTNYGTLVSPARPLPALALYDAAGAAVEFPAGKWTWLYLGGPACDAACEERLLLSRQVRLALNHNRERVRRVYLAPDRAALAAARAQLSTAHPDLVLLAVDAAAAAQFFTPGEPHALYLLDPLGNWLMSYTGEVQAKGLHKDIKKLMRFSQLG